MKDLLLFLSIHTIQHVYLYVMEKAATQEEFVSCHIKHPVEFVEAAADASYLWLKLKDVVLGCPEVYFCVSLIDWISDTRSQECTDLQSLVKCLDHRGIVLALDNTIQ